MNQLLMINQELMQKFNQNKFKDLNNNNNNL